MLSSENMHADPNDRWLEATLETAISYRRMIDGIIEQLTPDEFLARPAPSMNSVAVILRHLGGNLQSRWTDSLTSDGEKPELTHVSYHVGQMAMIARQVHTGQWKWQTIAPGESESYNQRTWGASSSRSVFAHDSDSE